MALRFTDGDGGTSQGTHGADPEWARRRRSALAVEKAAREISLRPGSDTVSGAQQLVDALDHYWQVRYGGRVVVVAPEEDVTP